MEQVKILVHNLPSDRLPVYPITIGNYHSVKVCLSNRDTVRISVDGLTSNVRLDAEAIRLLFNALHASAVSMQYSNALPSSFEINIISPSLSENIFSNADMSSLSISMGDAPAFISSFASCESNTTSIDLFVSELVRILIHTLYVGNILDCHDALASCLMMARPVLSEHFVLNQEDAVMPAVVRFFGADDRINFGCDIAWSQMISSDSEATHMQIGCSTMSLQNVAFAMPDECIFIFGDTSDMTFLQQTLFAKGTTQTLIDTMMCQPVSFLYLNASDSISIQTDAYASSFGFLAASNDALILDTTGAELSLYASYFISEWSDMYMSDLSDYTMQDMMLGEVVV